MTYLTALHNTHDHEKSWTKNIKSSPIEELKSPCLTLLVASNEVLFDSMVKMKDIEGGFIARTFIIHESAQKLINPLTEAPKRKLGKDELVDHLIKIGRIKGEFEWSLDAKEVYNAWYAKLCNLNVEDRTGSLGRLGDQVLKVAMLVSLSKKEELKLEVEDLAEAIKRSEECLPAIQFVSMSGPSEISESIARVLKTIISSPNQEITRAKLLTRVHARGVDSQVLDRVIESLVQSKAIDQPFRNSAREICYRMNKEAYRKYIQFREEE